jgi:PhnB protein
MASSDVATLPEKTSNAPEQRVVGGVIPHISVSDAAAAADFYKRAFGAQEISRIATPDGKRMMHVHLIINGGSVMMADFFPDHGYPFVPPQAFNLHLQVDDAQPWWDRALAAGAEVAMPLEVMFWGDRYGQLKDPFGVTWAIGAPA